MPGLTFAMTADTGRLDKGGLNRAQALLLHGQIYRANVAGSAPGLHVGWVAYDQYPVRVFSHAGYLIYLEGRIYNKPAAALRTELERLAVEALAPQLDDRCVEQFVLNSEGSYVVVIVRAETGEALMFTDPFGRLPLYYRADESQMVVSREAKFVKSLGSDGGFDRLGCAQVLAFGLPLGDRTVLEGVKSFPEAGLLRAERVDGRIRWRIRTVHSWNLDLEDGARSVTRHAAEFADLFVTACRTWGSHADSRGNLVSLSGGHDSRLVAAGLARSGSGIIAVTYRDPNGKREDEVRCARQVTEALGIEWHCLDLPPPAQSDYEELAWLKDGMNWISMAYILSYLTEIVGRWGRDWTYLSGDGGDDCLKVTAPKQSFWRLEDVVQYVLDKETCVPPDRAEEILRLPPGTIRAELHRIFASYPERDFARLIKHFKIFERGRRCYFEGEDRTRSFLWQDSPFYSMPVFQHCLRVPDRQKYFNVFCRQALLAVSPAAASVPVISSGYAPASWKYVMYHRIKEMVLALPGALITLARLFTGSRRRVSYVVPSEFMVYLRDDFAKGSPLGTLLDGKHVLRTLPEIDDAHSFFCLWTIVMLEKVYRLKPFRPSPGN